MDIKLITRHAPSNYGSLLQSYAAARVLEGLRHQCRIIDYQPLVEHGMRSVCAEAASKPGWKSNPLKKALYIALRWPGEVMAYKRFEAFRHKLLPLTRRYDSADDLKFLRADVYVTGSDQVWGPAAGKPFDDTYFLNFTVPDARRLAWAASFGRTQFSPEITEAFRDMLSRYEAITVREDAAVDTVTAMGLTPPQQVLDPTLMLDAAEWRGMCEPVKDVEKPYVLVYQLHNNNAINDYAVETARHMGISLVRVTPWIHQAARPGKAVLLPTPGQFLWLIDNAAMMVTDSFHGTVFACLFHTPFVDILPVNGTSSRNMSILRILGLESRVPRNYNDFSTLDNEIDFNAVDRVISRERAASMEILKKILK